MTAIQQATAPYVCRRHSVGLVLSEKGKKEYDKVILDLTISAFVSLAVYFITSNPYLQLIRMGIVALAFHRIIIVQNERDNNLDPKEGFCCCELTNGYIFLAVSNAILAVSLLGAFIYDFSYIRSGAYGLYYCWGFYSRDRNYTNFLPERNLLV